MWNSCNNFSENSLLVVLHYKCTYFFRKRVITATTVVPKFKGRMYTWYWMIFPFFFLSRTLFSSVGCVIFLWFVKFYFFPLFVVSAAGKRERTAKLFNIRKKNPQLGCCFFQIIVITHHLGQLLTHKFYSYNMSFSEFPLFLFIQNFSCRRIIGLHY